MQAIQQETLTHLQAWQATLKADQRELLALRFAAGLTVPQIAAVIGKKPDATKKTTLSPLVVLQGVLSQ